MHSTPSEFIIGAIIPTVVVLLVVALIWRYTNYIKPDVKRILKYLIPFYLICLTGSGIGQYTIFWSKPQYFQQGVQLLERHPYILSRIGSFQGYSYQTYKLPKHNENPATLELTVLGSKANMMLEVVLIKDEETKTWSIGKFLKDSLIQK